MYQIQKNIWIGTSNVVIPGNKESFPAPYNSKSRLHYYSFLFNSVEINQTFYKLPKPATFERWAAEVKDDFKFTVKLTKEITHAKNLHCNLQLIDTFLYAAERLQHKKGCLLLQFPGKITLDYFNELEIILQKIKEADGHEHWKVAVELRDNSWYTGETYELLNYFKAALVIQDKPKSKITENYTKAPFVYLRMHGIDGDYKKSYPDTLLQQKARQVIQWGCEGKEVFVYFNNTIGEAFENAQMLREMVEQLKIKG